MNRLTASRRLAQHGQALTEFLLIALVLIPIFLVLPLIAKYQDIAHATEMAARYVAFDATIRNDQNSTWKTPEELSGEVQRRFFSNPNAPIKTGDVPGDFKANQNLFWRDPEDKSLIRNFGSDIRVSFGESLNADRAHAFKGTKDGQPFLLFQDPLKLKSNGMYRANVTVTLANLSNNLVGPTKSYDKFKNISLTMTRHTDLVIDPWGARGPGQVIDKVGDPLAYPASALEPLRVAVDALVGIMESPRYLPGACFTCGPKIGKLDYWRDDVPADRLP
ncbi:hypothetical protein G4G28_09835 [Massilia sp. Dwa41.01b]|uniref:hypothetical protein n=1 Tax=unclassified Massilia TaxID=2609279 RepID=UPI0016030126|nr:MULTISPECIES: hypothetical protein [unclassified Massilia]QNA88718.1 hypothetical protein G4G28_09835 [Massilia sp. Dwa41.01b]QNA99617.1 hypothetical protein G4G31_13510 [Massilia sp. Se16.2.3]